MKGIILIVLLSLINIISATDNNIQNNAENYYKQLQEIQRNQKIIDLKIQLAKKIQECQKLNIVCDFLPQIIILKKQTINTPKNTNVLAKPILVSIIGNEANFTKNGNIITKTVNELIQGYLIIQIHTNFVLLQRDKQIHKLRIFWRTK